MSNPPDIGEQALDKVAEAAIANQLDEVEEVSVDIRTDPVKLVQGKVDSVAISGEGMVMKQDLRIDSVEVNTGAVAIDPLKAIVGQIELTQPANAKVQLVLTEQDLNRALSSGYLRSKMGTLEVEVQGNRNQIEIQRAQIQLPGDEKLAIDVQIRLQEVNEVKQLYAVTKPQVKEQGHRIELEILSVEAQGLSLDFAAALLNQIVQLLDLRNFDLDGLILQVENLEVHPGKLILCARSLVEKLPAG